MKMILSALLFYSTLCQLALCIPLAFPSTYADEVNPLLNGSSTITLENQGHRNTRLHGYTMDHHLRLITYHGANKLLETEVVP